MRARREGMKGGGAVMTVYLRTGCRIQDPEYSNLSHEMATQCTAQHSTALLMT